MVDGGHLENRKRMICPNLFGHFAEIFTMTHVSHPELKYHQLFKNQNLKKYSV